MKKAVIIAVFLLVFTCSVSVFADGGGMKIAMNTEVKPAKEIGTGKGISFTLPDLDSNEFYIYAIELAIFEKQNGESNWHIYKDENGIESKKQYIESPSSLTFNVDFGDAPDYREKAKYKIAYRYYVQSLTDTSVIIIAGADIKDGWRLVGESNSSAAGTDGFTFYLNSAPTMNIECFSYKVHSTEGLGTREVTDTSEIYFPEDVFKNGVTLQMTADDFDTEDILTVSYRLEDAENGSLIAESVMPYDKRIITQYSADSYRLYIIVSDNFGASVTSEAYVFETDREPPEIISEFIDGGYALMGKNLFSDFTVIDGYNEPMTEGSVYAEIYMDDVKKDAFYLDYIGRGVYRLDKTNMADGEYTVQLKIFDKAGNESEHNFYQTLDNTPPQMKFIQPEDNPAATYYSTWMNESKAIVINGYDGISGIKTYKVYLDNSLMYMTSYNTVLNEKEVTVPVSSSKTGKLKYKAEFYDNAKGIDKTLNKYKESSGNVARENKEVWLDKTNPSITVRHTDSGWREAPYTVSANFYDYPSSSSVSDASGVKTKLYSITESLDEEPDWSVYSGGVLISDGGVYYVHFKAVDNAGNETTETVRVRLNTVSQIMGRVRPTEDYKHTIYYSTPGFYVAKNTAYNTKYHFELKDNDVGDVIKTSVKLLSQDDSSIFGVAESRTQPSGSTDRDVIFNMPYLDADLNELPDGVYDMYITITEIKNDGEEIVTHTDFKDCEVVIKRNAPPTPIINTEAGKVSITYPEESLAGSLNNSAVKAHYKYQYKAVKDTDASTNVYKNYMGEFDADDFVVTALYTDIAGNTSVASKRAYKPDGGESSDSTSIITEGNTITVEESRAADVYYIGTRRDKNNGINNSVFGFLN